MTSLYTLLMTLVLTAGQWTPTDYPQFWIEPDTDALLRFETKAGTIPDASYSLRDTTGKEVSTGTGKIVGTTMTVKVKLSAGYYELEFPKTQQSFGLGVLALNKRSADIKSDPFFAIDGALSGLSRTEDIRKGLILSAKKIGIDMIRERLHWGGMEQKEGEYNTFGRAADTYRFFYKDNGVEVLELFHDSPKWIGQIEKKYPDDLIKTRNSWKAISKRWAPTWGAIEVWNEPDIGFGANLPADQYVPILKTLYRQFKKDGLTMPVVGGVNAVFKEGWMKSAADSGILDYCDIYSFHSYNRANMIETLYEQYMNWTTENGHPGMPLWITECGRPWKKGPGRAGAGEDVISAVDIVMKGIEAKACGIDRYFPFVYSYYEENDNNFGMTGKEGSPLRSIVAYAQSIRLLAGTQYIGDWRDASPEAEKARIFAGSQGRKVLVLYKYQSAPGTTIKLPFMPKFVERVTGEKVIPQNGAYDFSDGLLYVGLDSSCLIELKTDTLPMKLLRRYQAAQKEERAKLAKRTVDSIAPFVLRFDSNNEFVTFTSNRYCIRAKAPKEVKLGFDLFNFRDSASDRDRTFNISVKKSGQFGSIKDYPKSIKAAPDGRVRFELTLSTEGVSEVMPIVLNVTAESQGLSDSIHLVFTKEVEMKDLESGALLRYFPGTKRLNLKDASRWTKSCAPCGKMEFTPVDKLSEKVECKFSVEFGEGDRWIYTPFFPEIKDLSTYDGFLILARAESDDTNSSVRIIIEEENGENWITWEKVIDCNGEWQPAFVPLSNFSLLQGSKNGIFDKDRVKDIKFGGNTKGKKFTMEIGALYLYKTQK